MYDVTLTDTLYARVAEAERLPSAVLVRGARLGSDLHCKLAATLEGRGRHSVELRLCLSATAVFTLYAVISSFVVCLDSKAAIFWLASLSCFCKSLSLGGGEPAKLQM